MSSKGPQPKYDEPMKLRTLHLPDHLYDYAYEIGGGNFAEGVRRALEEHKGDIVKSEEGD